MSVTSTTSVSRAPTVSDSQLLTAQNRDGWKIEAQFANEPPTITVTDKWNIASKETIMVAFENGQPQDVREAFAQLQKEIQALGSSQNRFGFQVEKNNDGLLVYFGKYGLQGGVRDDGKLGGLLLTAGGLLVMASGGPVFLSAAALGSGIQMATYAYRSEEYSDTQCLKEGGIGLITGLATGGVGVAAGPVSTSAARVVVQSGANMTGNVVNSVLRGQSVTPGGLFIAAASGVVGAAAGSSVNRVLSETADDVAGIIVNNTLVGATNSGANTVAQNVLEGRGWNENLLASTMIGGAVGAAQGVSTLRPTPNAPNEPTPNDNPPPNNDGPNAPPQPESASVPEGRRVELVQQEQQLQQQLEHINAQIEGFLRTSGGHRNRHHQESRQRVTVTGDQISADFKIRKNGHSAWHVDRRTTNEFDNLNQTRQQIREQLQRLHADLATHQASPTVVDPRPVSFEGNQDDSDQSLPPPSNETPPSSNTGDQTLSTDEPLVPSDTTVPTVAASEAPSQSNNGSQPSSIQETPPSSNTGDQTLSTDEPLVPSDTTVPTVAASEAPSQSNNGSQPSLLPETPIAFIAVEPTPVTTDRPVAFAPDVEPPVVVQDPTPVIIVDTVPVSSFGQFVQSARGFLSSLFQPSSPRFELTLTPYEGTPGLAQHFRNRHQEGAGRPRQNVPPAAPQSSPTTPVTPPRATQETVICIKCKDLPNNQDLFIRGSAAGLNWNQGVKLVRLDWDTFEYRTAEPFEGMLQYKLLINDSASSWEQSSNHEIASGKRIERAPHFSLPPLKKTIIEVSLTVPAGMKLSLSGTGPLGNWDRKVEMKPSGSDGKKWYLSFDGEIPSFDYKIRLGDNWENGTNRRAESGKKTEVRS